MPGRGRRNQALLSLRCPVQRDVPVCIGRYELDQQRPVAGRHDRQQRRRAVRPSGVRWIGHAYGAVLFGRQYTPGYEVLLKYNVMQDATALSFGQGYNNPAIRFNNAIAYRAELKGFTAFAMYSFGGSEAPASARQERTAPPTNGDDAYGVNLQYNAPNWGVGVGYNQNYVVPYATQAAGTPTKKTGLEMFDLGGWIGFAVSSSMARTCSARTTTRCLRR